MAGLLGFNRLITVFAVKKFSERRKIESKCGFFYKAANFF